MTTKLAVLIFLCAGSLAAQNVERIAGLIQQGEIDQARRQVELLDDAQRADEKLFLRGLLATDGLEAERLYTSLCADYPDYSHCDFARYRLAQLKYARGLYISAKTEFRKLVEDYPGSGYAPKSYYWMGRCLQALNQPDSAQVLFQQASAASHLGTETSELARAALDSMDPGRESAPRPDTDTAPVTTAPDADGRTQEWTVQVGAFSSRQRAVLQKSFFENRGFEVMLSSKVRDGTTLYLVWTGSFTSRQDAWNYGEKLKKQYGTPFTLVTR